MLGIVKDFYHGEDSFLQNNDTTSGMLYEI